MINIYGHVFTLQKSYAGCFSITIVCIINASLVVDVDDCFMNQLKKLVLLLGTCC